MRKTDRNGPLRDALSAITLPQHPSKNAEAIEILDFDLTRTADNPTIVRVEGAEKKT
ncbi:MAG: hypothetical protein HN403_16560 [Rhodospirillales bacterium]|nr:hypothetical protein [Rhodospirillales bacterium]